MEKLYVIVRSDLPPGAQAAQSTHAAIAFTLLYPELTAGWAAGEDNLVLLAVPDERALGELVRQAQSQGIRTAAYHESAMQNSLTACAFSGEIAKAVSSLPLALRPPKPAQAAA